MVWKWIYNEKMGILNSVIRALGGKGIGWLTDPKIALYSVMIVGLWMSVGYNMIICLQVCREFQNLITKQHRLTEQDQFSYFLK